jgi:predicted GNAT family N-acyltransferase
MNQQQEQQLQVEVTIGDVRYRWVPGQTCTQAEWDKIDALLAVRGWMSLNRETSLIRLAESVSTGQVLGFNVIQLIPYVGPLYVVPSARASGVTEELIDHVQEFLHDSRGYMAIAQSPYAARACEQRGMRKVEVPVYVMGGT